MRRRRHDRRRRCRSWKRTFDGPGDRQAMSAVEGNDDEEAASMREKRDADGNGLTAGSTGSVNMPANCVVCASVCFSAVMLCN